MEAYDVLNLGNTSLMLIPCCSARFTWETGLEPPPGRGSKRPPRRPIFVTNIKTMCRAGVHARRTDEFSKNIGVSRFLNFAKVRRAKSPALQTTANALPNGHARKTHL